MPAQVLMPDDSIYTIHRLLAPSRSNTKLQKNGKRYLTMGLSMAPHRLGGIGNLCSDSSPDCRKLCINVSGRTIGKSDFSRSILTARIARSRFYMLNRHAFLEMLFRELENTTKRAKRDRVKLLARLNVFSDVDWARKHRDIITSFPDCMFYGYTKHASAFERFMDGKYPPNYYLTFSRSENNERDCFRFLMRGFNVTVVFDTLYSWHGKQPLPTTWQGFPVIDGDETDLRFLDPQGVIVGLRAKGLARRKTFQTGGFVVRTNS